MRRVRCDPVRAWADRRSRSRISTRTLEHSVLALKCRTPPGRVLYSPLGLGWIDRRIERCDPPFCEGFIADGSNDEQVASAGRGYVGDALAFPLFTRDLERLVVVQILRRPATDAER